MDTRSSINRKLKGRLTLRVLVAGIIIGIATTMLLIFASTSISREQQKTGSFLDDTGLVPELFAEGLEFPTSMAFIDDKNILVLQKNDGQIRLVSEGELLEKPVLQVGVTNEGERGLLGIAIWQDGNNDTLVFLYLTEIDEGKVRNRVYSYGWDGTSLSNKTLILDLPGEPGPFHDGGKIAIGPQDGNLYAIIGDVNAGGGMLDNDPAGRPPDDKSVVLRVDKNTGMPPKDNPFYKSSGDMEKLQRYYAYGIRNSFGMDFDPKTGKLWITENGPENYDEINLVEPGFNSGWHKVMGPISRTNVTLDDLVSFNGSSYRDPALSWRYPIGITDIEFFNSSNLGQKYENNIFVGDINYGNLYFFKINHDRNGLDLNSSKGLSDLVADPAGDDMLAEVQPMIIGKFDGRITDIETGPDGNLYVLTYLDGKIYRITEN